MSNPYDTASERMSILPPTLRFKGELSADEDLLIQGQIEGTVEGDLHAERSVYVEESGNLRGNIHAPSVCLVEGSKFNGSVDMDSKKSAQLRGKTGT